MSLFNKTYKDINLSPENVVAPNESLDPDVGPALLFRKKIKYSSIWMYLHLHDTFVSCFLHHIG